MTLYCRKRIKQNVLILYQYVTDVQEVQRYLKGVTGQNILLENLYFTSDGKIGGLPKRAESLINNTKDNAKIDRIKDALVNFIGNIKRYGDIGIPDFASEVQFKNGELYTMSLTYFFHFHHYLLSEITHTGMFFRA